MNYKAPLPVRFGRFLLAVAWSVVKAVGGLVMIGNRSLAAMMKTRQGNFFFWSGILAIGALASVMKDFNPEWKGVQKRFVNLTYNLAEKEIAKENAKIEQKYKARLDDLDKRIVEANDANRTLNQAEKVAAKQAEITALTKDEYVKSQELSFVKSELGMIRSKYEFLKNDEYAAKKDVDYWGKLYDEKFAEAQKLQPDADKAYADLTQAKDELKELEKGAGDLTRDREKIFQDMQNWLTEVERIKPTDAVRFTANVVRDLPLLDFIDPKFNLKQLVLNDLPDITGSGKVDRCITCHLGIADPRYADASIEPVFRAHPKMDLFVAKDSPHPVEKFGCTSCHLGRGYGTTFTLAAHTPNDEKQTKEWKQKYGWKDMHYWDAPMLPKRHQEAMCINCHKQTVGYELTMARSLFEGREIYERRGCHGCHKIEGVSDDMAKVGPSLLHLSAKLDPNWTPRWIAEPRAFYSETKMPHPFGHAVPSKKTFPEYVEHMEHELGEGHFDADYEHMVRDEAVVIESITAFLHAKSTDLEMDEPPAAEGDAELGKELVKTVNCLACHKVDQLEAAGEGYAPDLSKIGSKTNRKWLYNWLRDPKKYWPEGQMPNPRLTDDEANHVAAYLMTLKDDEFLAQPVPPVADDSISEIAVRYKRAKMGEDQAKREVAGMTTQERRMFIGQEAIYRYGCFGCHNIQGFETFGRIGAELSGEGAKEIELFDFGMHKYVHLPHTRHDWVEKKVEQPKVFFLGKVKNPYEQELHMPWFGFDKEEAAQIATFILGQTTKPVPAQYKYDPRGEKLALAKGRKIMERKNCAGCHKIGLGEQYIDPSKFDFAQHLVWATQPVVAKGDPNLPEGRFATVQQVPAAAEKDKVLIPGDSFIQGNALASVGKDFFSLSEIFADPPAEVDIGAQDEIKVPLDAPKTIKVKGVDEGHIMKFYEERAAAPPPLRMAGAKLEPGWFFNFLKHVEPVRNHLGALRMPQWEWTDQEANDVTAFFAAAAKEPFPFKTEGMPPYGPEHVKTAQELFGLPGAENYGATLQCMGCHPAGNFKPTNPPAQWGPNLYISQKRLKPGFVASWLRNPQSWFPGTRMPNVFFDYSEGDTPSKLREAPEEEIQRLTEMLYHMSDIKEIEIAAEAAAKAAAEAAKNAPPPPAEEFMEEGEGGEEEFIEEGDAAAKPAEEEEFSN